MTFGKSPFRLAALVAPFLVLACSGREAAEPPAQGAAPETEPQAGATAAAEAASQCSWHVAYDGARSGDYTGPYVLHLYDGRGASRVTHQVGFQKRNVLALTISFGGEPLPSGWTGTREMGQGDDDGRISLDLGEEFPWQNSMTGERRPFTVTITRNDDQAVEGTFQASLLNVPRRPEVNLGDIEAHGEFAWKAGGCRREES